MRRYLVVADETVGGQKLQDEIASRHEKEPSRFTVIVPASVPSEGLTWTEAEARGLAQDRLQRVLSRLDEIGVEGDGSIADADPFQAIDDTLREAKFDEVILSAPSKRSGWMKPNLPAKVESAFGLPVTFIQGEAEHHVRETALARAHLFAVLPKRDLRAWAKRTMVESYREGTTIVAEGSSDSDLYVILDGRVKVVTSNRLTEHLVVGEIFGEISLLDPGPRLASVIAAAPTRCLVLPGREFRNAMAQDPKLTARVLEATGARLRALTRSFGDALRSLILDGELLEELAESAHLEYCAAELAKGATWGEQNDAYLRRHESLARYAGGNRDGQSAVPNLVAYEHLSEQVKEQNRDLIREIPKKLASAGYVVRYCAPGESPARFSDAEIEFLAEREHDRWVRLKLAQGWSYAASRNEKQRRHPDLVPWRELGEEDRQSRFGLDGASRLGPGSLTEETREKDRVLMRKIGSILARVSLTAAKVEPGVE